MYVCIYLSIYLSIYLIKICNEPQPNPVTENNTIHRDIPIYTDIDIGASNPDIIIKDKLRKRYILIDQVIPNQRNPSLKVIEKLSKYK